MGSDPFADQRKKLVDDHIRPLGVEPRIIDAFLRVPRHAFIPVEYQNAAYENTALPIGEDQTISQPSLVALMTAGLDLKGGERVLEIGTGSGYQAAILSLLVKEVFTVERLGTLAQRAKRILKSLGYKNVRGYEADGSLGLARFAPFDAIIVTAGAREIPAPLENQLKDRGRLVIPVGEARENQKLIVGVKIDGKLRLKETEPVRFVPLVGKYGWGSGQA